MTERGRLLGQGKVAEVFESGALALKLYRPGNWKSSAFREAAILATIEAFGVAAPRIRAVEEIEGRWGVLMTRTAGRPFAEAMASDPKSVSDHLEALATLHKTVHACDHVQLPSLQGRLAHNIGRTEVLSAERKKRLLNRLEDLPDGTRLLHGDFHPYNVLGVPGAAEIVDWLDASSGVPAADVCRSYVLLSYHSVELAESYLAAYLAGTQMTRTQVMDWLAVTAAARLDEHVPEQMDQLVAMAETD